jgi:hypothetical protein
MRADVEAQIADRSRNKESRRVRLEDIVKPVLLAFCVNSQNQPVYVKRTKPFRYEVGNIPADRATDYILVEPEYRRPGLRIDHPHLLPLSDKRDLESLIEKWAAVHAVQVEQFSKVDEDGKELSDFVGSALDRLLSAQPPDIASRIMIPADIAQILSRIRCAQSISPAASNANCQSHCHLQMRWICFCSRAFRTRYTHAQNSLSGF